MILSNILNIPGNSKIELSCDKCNLKFERKLKDARNSRNAKNSDKDYCRTCSFIISASKKPQCSKEYWDNEVIKKNHGKNIKNSKKYQLGIENRGDNSGDNNPMFGKKHKPESISKMIIK